MLVCLKEFYIEFKKCNPQLKIGFTIFCVLPKWCITAASKGSHTVCVCSHQNVKLLCSAISGNLDYKEHMNLCVCDLADQNCMFHLCENCPDITNLSNYLKNIFEDNDFDDDDKINYRQWVATDCTTLIKKINWCLTDPANQCLTDINQYYISCFTYPVLVILNR